MGITMTHNCFNGTYGQFAVFRRKLAKEISIDLEDYAEYNPRRANTLEELKHPFRVLFLKEDRAGRFTILEMQYLANGFQELCNKKIRNRWGLEVDFTFWKQVMDFLIGLNVALHRHEEVEW